MVPNTSIKVFQWKKPNKKFQATALQQFSIYSDMLPRKRGFSPPPPHFPSWCGNYVRPPVVPLFKGVVSYGKQIGKNVKEVLHCKLAFDVQR